MSVPSVSDNLHGLSQCSHTEHAQFQEVKKEHQQWPLGVTVDPMPAKSNTTEHLESADLTRAFSFNEILCMLHLASMPFVSSNNKPDVDALKRTTQECTQILQQQSRPTQTIWWWKPLQDGMYIQGRRYSLHV
jgi:hypothetical protein